MRVSRILLSLGAALSLIVGTALPATASSRYLDELGRPTPHLQQQVREIAAAPWMPEEVSNLMLTALAFTAGTGSQEGGIPLPEDAPTFTQFYWPTVSGNCIGGTSESVASAIAVPGPAEIPAPGAKEGETAFVFTALGTAAATEEQGEMHVHWVNATTRQYGVTPLENNGINPEGPATLSGVAETGTGQIAAVVTGSVKTEESTCNFLPTLALFQVQ